jgi:hypothetical protein
MAYWTVTFTNKPIGNSISRIVSANGKQQSITVARESLNCPSMWEYVSSTPVCPDENIAAPQKEATEIPS